MKYASPVLPKSLLEPLWLRHCQGIMVLIPIRPSWSLIRKLGVGDLSKLCTITYLIAYPYAWTVNFEICIDVQLTTPQPPISKTSQAAAWSHRYIGYWMGKTEGSPIGFIAIFWRLKSWTIPLAKVVDFERLGALFGPGAPDPDLAPVRLRWQAWKHEKYWYFIRRIAILEIDFKMQFTKPLQFLAKMNIYLN